ncbi:TolC family protein [Acidipila rosea]|uniref:Outer membrane protein TolC n=1 Tax=Acidipila rosea TaxID=768535 RepID=A0A4R1LC30_9BACT|nr:TolC family protein [Acidipila rosea]TCK75885.1 outer membrane protein TolC [Acidipila rosea]
MKRSFCPHWRELAACLLGLMLSGCASYRPHPLPTAPNLASAPELTVPSRQFFLPGLPPHPISPSGLDETTVVMLAVFNNPDLKAARLQAGVASAQLLEAGLLPDPQFGAGYATSALNYGGAISLTQDIQAMITRGAAKAAARAAQKQVNLNILWQEIQVAERARELFIQVRSNKQLQDVVQANQVLLLDRYRRDQAAMERGDETAGITSADLILVTDADATLRQLQTEVNLTEHQLNELLGLQPDVQLHLVGPTHLPPLTKGQFDEALAALSHKRTDLLALAAGYHSQEENLRKAILAQFPSLTAGVNLERDPIEGVNAFGPEVTLTLPIFNRNRGQIAIQQATREALRETYQAQLDAAASQADQVWKATRIMAAQLQDLDAQLPVLAKTAAAAERSYRQNNLNAGLYVSVQSDLLSKQAEAIHLRTSLDNAQSALRTLLGLPFAAP